MLSLSTLSRGISTYREALVKYVVCSGERFGAAIRARAQRSRADSDKARKMVRPEKAIEPSGGELAVLCKSTGCATRPDIALRKSRKAWCVTRGERVTRVCIQTPRAGFRTRKKTTRNNQEI